MIRESQLTAIGQFLKPHGINGEISMSLEFDTDLGAIQCIVLNMDGIFVPFFIESFRDKSSNIKLVTLDGISDETKAMDICGKTVYALSTDCQTEYDSDNGLYASDLIGYTILDKATIIGKITDIDDSTENALFLVETSNGIVYIPIADEFIEDIIPESKSIIMDLPQGLLEL